MIPLSTRAKEAIKTSLAIVIAYAIALSLGWDRPYWAAFSVAMIALPTAGQSVRKGVLRMAGTLVAGVAALTFFAMFPQDRWLWLSCVSLYIGFCTYMLAGDRNQYFWFVAAFVCLTIMFHSVPIESRLVFETATARVEETAMGILVYTLIATFIWPRRAQPELQRLSCRLAAVQHRLYLAYRNQMRGGDAVEEARPLVLQEMQLLGQVGQALDGAEADSYEVWELRHEWRRFHALAWDLAKTLGRWRESAAEVREIDLSRILHTADAVDFEVQWRLAQIERMFDGHPPANAPASVSVEIDRSTLGRLGHFERAAVSVAHSQLEDLERLSLALFECAADIRGFSAPSDAPVRSETPVRPFRLDPDRLHAAATAMLTMWAAFFIWVYVDTPGHEMLIFVSTLAAMVAALSRQDPRALVMPALIGVGIAHVLYVGVMPHLSGFAELAAMLFVTSFVVQYVWWRPRQTGMRAGIMGNWISLVTIANQQTYDYASMANNSIMTALAWSLPVVVAYALGTRRPEKVFLRLLRRFFRHADFLMARIAVDWEQKKGLAGRSKALLYGSDLLDLPGKLEVLADRIDYRALPGTRPEQVSGMVNALRALAFRIEELVEARQRPQADYVLQELLEDVRAWRLVIQDRLRAWSEDLVVAVRTDHDVGDRLAARLARLEARVEETLQTAGEGVLTEEDRRNLYRVLGAFRGLSEAGVQYRDVAAGIDWGRWQEARF